mmetsp:Transcript_56363/g.175229  ORF Transcript_56363/g.175229 Transcript_56363/m.175229 type:complete len:509 (+) Transcript_56363:100-1626(+)
MLGFNDEEKCLFLLSAVPPLVSTLYVFIVLQRSPRPFIESLCSVVPGFQKPRFKDGMACLRLDASADVIRTFSAVLKDHQQLLAADLEAMGVDQQFFRRGSSAVAQLTRRMTSNLEMLTQAMQMAVPGNESDSPADDDREHELEDGGLGQDQPRRRRPSDSLQHAQSQNHIPGQVSRYATGISEREIWVNTSHLSRLSIVPSLFLSMYFWDAAVLSRGASVDFPLENCMGGSSCFFILQEYSMWKYPKYNVLDCDGMRTKTLASASDQFFFNMNSVPGARFFKCYTWTLDLQNFIQAAGDVLALLAVTTVAILYFCVEVTSGFHGTRSTSAGALADLKLQYRWCLVKQVAWGLGALALLVGMSRIYGKELEGFAAYMGAPSFCLFVFILYSCRRELLKQRIAEMEREDDDESGDSSDDADGSYPPPNVSAPAVRPLLSTLAATTLTPPLATAPAAWRPQSEPQAMTGGPRAAEQALPMPTGTFRLGAMASLGSAGSPAGPPAFTVQRR